jgi:hypothetical protein
MRASVPLADSAVIKPDSAGAEPLRHAVFTVA